MKKRKFYLLASILAIVIGLLTVGVYILIVIDANENTMKWIGSLILSILFILMGITGIINYNKDKK